MCPRLDWLPQRVYEVKTDCVDRGTDQEPTVAGKLKVSFITGYPQNQAQRIQSRTAIQGNSARLRWLKRATTAESASVKPQQRQTGGKEGILQFPVNSLQDHSRKLGAGRLPEKVRGQPCTDEEAMIIFERSLKVLMLPPFLPLEHADLMTTGEVWTVLQRSKSSITSSGLARDPQHRLTAVQCTNIGRVYFHGTPMASVDGQTCGWITQ